MRGAAILNKVGGLRVCDHRRLPHIAMRMPAQCVSVCMLHASNNGRLLHAAMHMPAPCVSVWRTVDVHRGLLQYSTLWVGTVQHTVGLLQYSSTSGTGTTECGPAPRQSAYELIHVHRDVNAPCTLRAICCWCVTTRLCCSAQCMRTCFLLDAQVTAQHAEPSTSVCLHPHPHAHALSS